MIGLRRWTRLAGDSWIREVKILPVGMTPDVPLPALPSPVGRYAELIREHQNFHHIFWARNNTRFAQAQKAFEEQNPRAEEWARFYQSYMLKHRAEFDAYHRETWRRNLQMLWEEYRFNFYQIVEWLIKRQVPDGTTMTERDA